MPGQRLPLATVREVLDDAAAAGVRKIRFYGGEPLLHPDLPAMIAHACGLGLEPYITSNGTHLGRRVQALYEAGLRLATIGFYGTGEAYDGYTQRHGMYFHVDLASYSTPFFVHDSERGLLFTSADRPRAEEVTRAMLALKRAEPERFLHSIEFIRSVPDWLLLGARMQVPCDAYELLWLGADGTLQLCDTALRLGNVHERPLRALLFTEEHRQAAYDGFKLNCPNCTCKAGSRIQRDLASARRYGRPMVGENV
jgi:cyclic pyranopterin phosphate synthase